jgi:hypothetical protein
MNVTWKSVLSGTLSILFYGPAVLMAYETPTHEWISKRAFGASVISQRPDFFLDLGFERKPTFTDGKGEEREVVSVIVNGAVVEDDIPRFLRHFYDPQADEGERGLKLGVRFAPSPDWILEDRFENSDQQYSLRDQAANRYLALTAATESERKKSFGAVLESVGRVIHHLQDMSQPAHVRSDAHGDEHIAASGYEPYVLGLTELGALVPSVYDFGSPAALDTFKTARSFWENNGRGIAEFTSFNFVSQDTNFRWLNPSSGLGPAPDADHGRPGAVPCAGKPLLRHVKASDLGVVLPGDYMTFVATRVDDLNSAVACNERTSSYSVFDSELELVGRERRFSLNKFNYDAALDFLIPRAIAYSAALINYVFRGQLQVENITFLGDRAVLTVKNVAEGGFALSELNSDPQISEFEVFYEAVDGTRKRADTLGDNLRGGVVALNETREIEFRIPADVDRRKLRPYILVFRGKIGEEEGVIGQTFGGGGTVVIHPNIVPMDGVEGGRVLNRMDGGWELSPLRGAMAGNVDWRGSNGDVVTWDGPQSRYFLSDSQRQGVSPNIYVGGALVARAPGNVLGAAMRSSRYGDEIVAAVIFGDGVTIFARPLNAGIDSPFDVNGNSKGWRFLGSVVIGSPDSPVFFNSSATEAQVLADGFEWRHKISVGPSSITSQRLETRGKAEQQSIKSWNTSYSKPEPLGGYTYSSSADERASVSWSEPNVACADYIGDKEVFCEIVSGPTSSSRGTSGISCTSRCWIGSYNSESEAVRTDRRVLRSKSIEIVLGGYELKQEGQRNDARGSGSFSILSTSISREEQRSARIYYLDIRNGIAVYETAFDSTDRTGTTRSVTNRLEWEVLRTKSKTTQVIAQPRPGSREIVASAFDDLGTEIEEKNWRYLVYGDSPLDPEDPFYSSGSGSIVAPPSPYQDNARVFSLGNLHPAALGGPNQGFATTSDGSTVASVDIWMPQDSGPDRRVSNWTYMTGGSLSAVVGGESEGGNSVYFPIGLIR